MGVITKLDYILGSFLCILGSFHRVKIKVKNGGYFGGLLNFKYLLGCLKFLIFFGGRMVDAGPEPTYEAKMRVPPLGKIHGT